MFANQGRRPGRSPAAHGIWKRAAAAFAAVILLAVTLFSDIPTVHSDSGTWEKEPYNACYLMFDTDPTNNENVHDGLMFEGHRDFTKGVMESYSNWEAKTGVDLTSRELWAPVYEWLQIVSGNQPVTPLKFPYTGSEGLFGAFQTMWGEMLDLAADIPGNIGTIRAKIENFCASSGNYQAYFDVASGRSYYIRVTTVCDEHIPDRYRTTAGNYGYCLNWDYKFPKGQGADDVKDREGLKEYLHITDGQYNKLVNILKLGYPTNTNLPQAYAGFPEDALRCGTQAALWIYLRSCNAAGNDGNRPLTLDNMQDVTDPQLNPSGITNLSAYVRYLLNTADESAASIPGAEMTGFEAGAPAVSNDRIRMELKIRAKNCSEYVLLRSDAFPKGCTLEALDAGSSVTNAPDGFHLSGFDKASDTEHRYALTFPADGNTGKTLKLTAAAAGKFTNTEMSLHWDENLYADEHTTQIMTNIHIDEFPVSAPLSAERVLPGTDVFILKTDPEGGSGGLPGASLHLEKQDGSIVKTGGGSEVRWVSGTEAAHFTDIPAGTYLLKEDSAPQGYRKLNEQRIEIRDTAMPQTFRIMNERVYGRVTVFKSDRTDGKPLEGAAFELFYAEKVTDRNGNTLYEKGEKAVDRNGDLVPALSTGADGKASMETAVPVGVYDENGLVSPITYELKETVTPPGQYEAVDPVQFRFSYEDGTESVVTQHFDLTDPSPHLEFHKDAEKKTFVGNKEDAKDEDITIVSPEEEIIYVLTLQNNGAAAAHNVLVKDPLPEDVTYLSYEADMPENVEFLREEEGVLYFRITGLLPGEKLTLRIRTKVTESAYGKKTVFVNTAYYHMPERPEEKPEPEDVPEWEPSEDVLYQTTVTEVHFLKKDAEALHTEASRGAAESKARSLNGLAGALLCLETEDGKTVKTYSGKEVRFVSGKEETVFTGIPAGTYFLREEKAPEGYQKTEPVKVVIEETAEVQYYTAEDGRTYGSLSLVKRDETTNEPLSGAVFQLVYAEDIVGRNNEVLHRKDERAADREGLPVPDLITGPDGTASMDTQVPIGVYDENGFFRPIVYALVETAVPKGQYEAADPAVFSFEYKDDGTPVVMKSFDLTDPGPLLSFRKTAEKETFEGRKEEASEEEITQVSPGEEIVYIVTLENNGTAPAYGLVIKDPLTEDHVFLSQETQGPANAEFRTDEEEKTLYWYIEKLLPGEKVTVRIRAAVSDALFGKKAVLLNTAYYYMPEDVPQEPDEDRENPPEWPVDPSKIPPSSWIPSEDILYRTVPEPAYEFRAERLSEAQIKPETDVFGFFREDTVQYLLTVRNTGNTALHATLSVEPEMIAEGVLQDLSFLSLEGEGAVWENERESMGTDIFPVVFLQPGRTAKVLFSCRIGAESSEYTARKSMDDKEDPYDGYEWRCRAFDVHGTYEERIFRPGSQEDKTVVERPADETVFSSLLPKEDRVNTPVQLRYGYTLMKTRISKAPEARQETGRYGFRIGTEVLYRTEIVNTGDVPLTMRVFDAFDTDGEAFFTLPHFTDITGDGVIRVDEAGSGNDENPVISIPPGMKAELISAASAGKDAVPYLSGKPEDDKADDADGYISFVTAADVEAHYAAYERSEEGIILKDCVKTEEDSSALIARSDFVNTPVQVIVGRVAGAADEKKPSKPVVLGIDTASERRLFTGMLILGILGTAAAVRMLVGNRKKKQEEKR